MTPNTSVTLRPCGRVINLYIVSEEHETAHLINAGLPRCPELLNADGSALVAVRGAYDAIPETLIMVPEPDVVLFDPEMDLFRDTSAGIRQLRETFGKDALYVVNSDVWTRTDSRLRKALVQNGITVGIPRNDFQRLLNLLTQLTRGLPAAVLAMQFGT